MEPATMTALAAITSAALQGLGSGFGGAAQAKAEKRKAKEMKRQTLADMYNKALQREFDLYRFGQEQGGANTARRAAALQETANGFSRSLLGR